MSEIKNKKTERLKEYRSLSIILQAVVSDFSEAELNFIPDGKWSVRQIVHHVVDSDAVVKTMILAAIGNSGCTYDQSWYPTDNAWAATMVYERRDVSSAVSLFQANVIHLENLLKKLPEAWDRFVIFKWPKNPEGIQLSVDYLINSRIEHTEHHIKRIREIQELIKDKRKT